MPRRKITLRRMAPVTRKYARLIDELESIHRRLKKMTEEISQLELDSRALAHAKDIPGRLPLRNSGRDFIAIDKD